MDSLLDTLKRFNYTRLAGPILIILIAGICGYFFGKRGGNGK